MYGALELTPEERHNLASILRRYVGTFPEGEEKRQLLEAVDDFDKGHISIGSYARGTREYNMIRSLISEAI